MFDVRLPNIRWLEERGSMDHILKADPSQEQGLILFYSSSNMTRWSARWHHRPLEEDIRMKDGSRAAVNHGFGTSTAEEQLYYYDRCVRPWAPRALILGGMVGNDYAAGYTASEIIGLQARIFEYARKDFPGIKLYMYKRLPTIKASTPTPAKRSFDKEYDLLQKAYCDSHDDVTFLDVGKFPAFFQEGHVGDYNYPREELFVEDGMHFNQQGYDVYRDFFLQALDDIL